MQLTEIERAYLANAHVRAIVEHGRANPDKRIKWARRTPKAHQPR